MAVTRIREDPRVTKPYTRRAVGGDRRARPRGRRARSRPATCGSRWAASRPSSRSTTATATSGTSPRSGRRSAGWPGELVRRLRERFAPGGLLHFGQGKWYPGESLPRWALGCYWRRDGEPVWDDPGAGRRRRARLRRDRRRRASASSQALARRLGVDPRLRDRRLRGRLVLPLARAPPAGERRPARRRASRTPRSARAWRASSSRASRTSSATRCRSRRRARWQRPALAERPLVPPARAHVPDAGRLADGLSPAARLAAVGRDGGRSDLVDVDPFAPRAPLPLRWARIARSRGSPPSDAAPRAISARRAGRRRERAARRPAARPGQSAADTVRTALCVEPRDGRLHVFMPPLGELEDYLELVAAVEATAAELAHAGARRRLPRRRAIHACGSSRSRPTPASSRSTCTRRRAGTSSSSNTTHPLRGGAPHAGSAPRSSCSTAATPAPAAATTCRSAARRRPTARSSAGPICCGACSPTGTTIPSLSYLFSGLFIGPTSQAPRVDEARNDSSTSSRSPSAQVPEHRRRARPGSSTASSGTCWSTSPATRTAPSSASTSSTRPTRRAAGSASLELRAFEMPPHARMSLVQQLLVRALVARFWDAAVHDHGSCAGAPSCTTASCCRTSSRRTSTTCCDELAQAGFPFAAEWFAPHLEFRFPRDRHRSRSAASCSSCGTRSSPGTCSARRPGGGGTVRYVDSSLERLQVQAARPDRRPPRRHLQRPPVPLHPTGTNGEYVAGVRYRAWQPPSCLHPTIPVHAPLVFDLVDTWSRPLARRLHLPRRAPGRPRLRHVPGERLRGRGAPGGALLPVRPHAGAHDARRPPIAIPSSRSRSTCGAPDGASIEA